MRDAPHHLFLSMLLYPSAIMNYHKEIMALTKGLDTLMAVETTKKYQKVLLLLDREHLLAVERAFYYQKKRGDIIHHKEYNRAGTKKD